jgi:hypothetical protein
LLIYGIDCELSGGQNNLHLNLFSNNLLTSSIWKKRLSITVPISCNFTS